MAALSDQLQDKKGTDDQSSTAVTHALLVKDLRLVTAKWEEFGLHLGVPFDELQKIRNNTSGRTALVDFCFNRVIDAWLNGNRANVTKEFLIEAIEGVGGHANLVPKVKAMTFKKKPKAGPIVLLLKDLKPKYSQLGIMLGVDLGVIRGFETLAGDAGNCLNQTVFYWLHSTEDEEDDDEESNRETLFEALKAVGHTKLAQDLEDKYRDMEFPGDDKPDDIN